MPSVRVVDTGLVYRNPMPHLRARHAIFPSLAQLPGGEIVAAMDLGSAFEAVDVRSYCCRSTDGGKTWTEPKLIFKPDESAHPVSTSCRITAVSDRELVGLACLMDRSRGEMGLANPATEGFVRTEFALVRSTDGGRSWSAPQVIKPPVDWHAFEVCSPIIPVASGRWLAPTAFWPDWEGHHPFGSKAVVFVSDDRGKTWPKCVDVMNRVSEKIGHYEQKVITLSDGRLMALCWVIDLKIKQDLDNHWAVSTNNAESFSPPMPTPLHGETCTPLALPGNNILCVYRRMDKRGLWAHLARIEGNRWTALAEEPLWGTNVEAKDSTSQSLLAQMSTLRFGCPSVIGLADGDVMTAFWCVEDCVYSIRWYRLRVES